MTDWDWTATQNRIIAECFWRIGVVPVGEDPSGEQHDIALFELNSIMKNLSFRSIPFWSFYEYTITTADGTQGDDVTDANAVYIDTAWIVEDDLSITHLSVYSQDKWTNTLDNKNVTTSKGKPTGVYFEKGKSTPKIYMYPTPDAVYTLVVRLAKRMPDWESASASTLIPQEWIEPISWKLCANLSHVFRLPLKERQVIEGKAEESMRGAMLDNFKQNDRGEVYFEPA